jgi:hypothetical protein
MDGRRQPYSPDPQARFAPLPGERHKHSFLLRGYLYGLDGADPEQRIFRAHLTDRRFVLEQEDGSAPIALDWNGIIEFEQIAGSRAVETFRGAEDHMIHMQTTNGSPFAADQVFLFFAEPLGGAPPAERPRHSAAFVAITDDLLVDAFENGDAEDHTSATR